MADFGTFKTTNQGLDLEYKAQSGKPLTFTKFVLGDGYYTGAIKELTNVVSPKMQCPVIKIDTQIVNANNKKVTISFNLDTSNIQTGFYLREIGLYAKDPDTNEELLAFYGNSGDTADYIPSSQSTTVSQKIINLELYIADVDTITAIIDNSLIYATQQELVDLKNEVRGLDVTEYAIKPIEITLLANSWELNDDTGYYEYIIEDETVTENYIANCYFDMNNTNILNGKTETSDELIKIIITDLPKEDIDATITLQKTTTAPGEGSPRYSYNYNDLVNKPEINEVILAGNKTSSEIGVADEYDVSSMTEEEIIALINENIN